VLGLRTSTRVVRTWLCVRLVVGLVCAYMNDERLYVRLPAGLKGRLPSGPRERSAFVRRALEAALGGALENAPGDRLRSLEGEGRRDVAVPVSPRAPEPKKRSGEYLPLPKPTLRCPAPGCVFAATSPKACCPDHGRTVVAM
jgi:hypothetical protein